MATPVSAASCFSRARNDAQLVEEPGRDWADWAKPVACRRYCAADGPVGDERRLLVHIPAESRVAGRHQQSPKQGPMRKSNFGGSRCST